VASPRPASNGSLTGSAASATRRGQGGLGIGPTLSRRARRNAGRHHRGAQRWRRARQRVHRAPASGRDLGTGGARHHPCSACPPCACSSSMKTGARNGSRHRSSPDRADGVRNAARSSEPDLSWMSWLTRRVARGDAVSEPAATPHERSDAAPPSAGRDPARLRRACPPRAGSRSRARLRRRCASPPARWLLSTPRKS